MLKADDRAVYDSVMAPQRTGCFVAGSPTEDHLALARDLVATGLAFTVNLRDGNQVKKTTSFLTTMAEKYSDLACAVTLRCVDSNDPDFDLPPTSPAEQDAITENALSIIGSDAVRSIGTTAAYGFRLQWLGRVVSAQRLGHVTVSQGSLGGGGEARPGDWPRLLELGTVVWKQSGGRDSQHVLWCGPALSRLELLDTRLSRLEGFGMDRRDLIASIFTWCAEHKAHVTVPLLCESGDAAYTTLGLAKEFRETVGVGGVWVPRWRPTDLPVEVSTEEVMRDIFAAQEAFGVAASAYGPLTRGEAIDVGEQWWAATDGTEGQRGSPLSPVYGALQSIATAAYKGT